MSIFGRLVGGAAQAGAQIANKYIDDQIATQRAQMLAELQRTTAGQIREDDDAFRNDPTRVQRDRDRRTADIEADGKVRRQQKVADLTDPDLVTAESTKAERDAADARRRRVDDITATTPAEVNRASLLAEAHAKMGAKYREPRAGGADPFEKLPAAVKVAYAGLQKQADQINAAMVKAQADGMWEPEKNKAQADLMVRLRATQDKAAALLDPHLPKQPGRASADDEIRKMLLGTGDVKPAAAGATGAAQAKPAAKPVMQRAEEASKDPIAMMDERMLKRIAAIPGHAKQKEALAELERRKANTPEVDTTGFGFGNPGA